LRVFVHLTTWHVTACHSPSHYLTVTSPVSVFLHLSCVWAPGAAHAVAHHLVPFLGPNAHAAKATGAACAIALHFLSRSVHLTEEVFGSAASEEFFEHPLGVLLRKPSTTRAGVTALEATSRRAAIVLLLLLLLTALPCG
jgi:hypothetical protein